MWTFVIHILVDYINTGGVLRGVGDTSLDTIIIAC